MSVLPGVAPLTIGLLRGLLRAPGLAIGRPSWVCKVLQSLVVVSRALGACEVRESVPVVVFVGARGYNGMARGRSPGA